MFLSTSDILALQLQTMIVGPRGTRVVLTLKRKQSQGLFTRFKHYVNSCQIRCCFLVKYKTELIRGDALLFLEIDNRNGLSKLNVIFDLSPMVGMNVCLGFANSFKGYRERDGRNPLYD